ncbi:hypothetical protein [Rubellimicrobium roseum]|uniref:hypothetical protein n=1 Tax=Rubellimicrobium roseum TaxID=687525 RepID=UPI001C3F4257|nr:hypothetical protein [Rubellimicrobium roseum]
MRVLSALAALLVPAAPAAADCLGGDHLGRGVVVTFENGDRTTLRRLADGAIEVEERRAGEGAAMRYRSAFGVYFFEEVELDEDGAPVPGTRLEVLYPQDPLTLPPPAPGIVWSGRTTNRFADGQERAEIATVRFLEGEPLEIGGCSYRTVAAELRYDWGKAGGLTLRYDYLIDLGAAVIRSNRFDGSALRETRPVRLAPARK